MVGVEGLEAEVWGLSGCTHFSEAKRCQRRVIVAIVEVGTQASQRADGCASPSLFVLAEIRMTGWLFLSRSTLPAESQGAGNAR